MTSPADTEPPPLLLALPADISLHVLAYLSLHDLYHLRLTSKRVHEFFEAHEEPIYHQAAIYHHFVRSRTSLEEAALANGPWLSGVSDWKELCRRWVTLERNWDGRGFVREGGLSPREDTVIDFVIDEDQHTAISLSRKGGLTVRALEDGRLLWASSNHSGIEIWRRATNVHTTVLRRRGEVVHTPLIAPHSAAVRDFQVQAGVSAPVVRYSDRGHFLPHAYIDTSRDIGPVRLFRVHYPLLAYVGFNAPLDVVVVDVTSGDVVWRVSVGQGRVLGMPSQFNFPPPDDRITMDIDLTHEYMSVCMYTAVVLYRLPAHLTSDDVTRPSSADGEPGENPPDMLVLGDIDTPAARQTTAHLLMLAAADRTEPVYMAIHGISLPVLATPRGQDVLERYDIVPPPLSAQRANMHALVPAGVPRVQPGFVCARFSPDGKHLVAATAFGLLYFAWDFARVERGVQFSDITEYLLIDEPLRDVSWDSELRRLAVRTVWEDVFILTMNSSYYNPRSSAGVEPHSSSLLDFSNRELVGWARGQGAPFNGMQMTRTALWLVWDVALLSNAVNRRQARAEGERNFDPAPAAHDEFGLPRE
ncbi:hypothetical protein BN946_scf185015.g114 [Trametes cinnabarina]|uniref:F-box domain-containing protein n=1 Tax=Pycnoporus cinnabarinus TaxID=5643 RepID=A0A060SHZ9_PYCCI|nr:hypothetical protein BN946_scf185015.g114 [Trametes cinnabarina]